MADVQGALEAIDELAQGYDGTATVTSTGMVLIVWPRGQAHLRPLDDGTVEWIYWGSSVGELSKATARTDDFFIKYGFHRYRGWTVKHHKDLPLRENESPPDPPASLIALQNVGFEIVLENEIEWVLEADITPEGRRREYRSYKAGKSPEPDWHKALQ